MPSVTKIGAIESATIPGGWFELPRQPNPFEDSWSRSFTLHSTPSVEMTFRFRGNEVDKTSATAFKRLLEFKKALLDTVQGDEKQLLSPDEIRELQVVMGYETAGDNQHTFLSAPLSSKSSAHLGSVRQPTFELRSATVRNVANKAVLLADGKFHSGNYYLGCFYPGDLDHRVVEEFMFHAPSSELYDQYAKQFLSVLDTIVWRG